MSMVLMTKKGYGQIELNQVAFRRTGASEAQCKLDTTQFPTTGGNENKIGYVAENGMLLAVDKASKKLLKATVALAATSPIGIHYSEEKLYDERKPQLRNFYMNSGSDFLPRVGFLSVGDRFTTNCICFDDGYIANDTAITTKFNAGPVYATIASDGSGYWQLVEDRPVPNPDATPSALWVVGPVARLVEVGTMPDGQLGLKLMVISI